MGQQSSITSKKSVVHKTAQYTAANLGNLAPEARQAVLDAAKADNVLYKKKNAIVELSVPFKTSSGGSYYEIHGKVFVKPGPKTPPADTTAFTYAPASSMKFNLPPHEWSLPIDPSLVNSDLSKPKTDHGLRRARLWFYGSSTTTSGVNLVSSTGGTKPKNVSQTFTTTAEDNYWGFQFLWNPTTIQTAVSRQANFTPSSTDALAGLQGLFTAMETVQFTIVLDRINDFAWIKNGGSINSLSQVDTTTLAGIATASDNPYKAGGQIGVYQDQGQQVIDLLNKGTMADVEYLFRAINGIGVGGKAWTNALGRETADIGFLTPNPIALQLGPTGDSLSYVGWIDALAIQHSVFTENMVPLHTEIQVTFNVFSKVSLQSGN